MKRKGSTVDLAAADYNPRKITGEAMERLSRQLAEFGDLGGIVYNLRTGRLVGGHQRVRSLEGEWPIEKSPSADGCGTVAVGWIDTPHGRFAYREVDWDEAKEKLANLAANNQAGEFDRKLLAPVLRDLQELDLSLSGFSSGALEKFLSPPLPPKIEPWDLATVYEPFWIVVRGPASLFPRVREALSELQEESLVVESSLG